MQYFVSKCRTIIELDFILVSSHIFLYTDDVSAVDLTELHQNNLVVILVTEQHVHATTLKIISKINYILHASSR